MNQWLSRYCGVIEKGLEDFYGRYPAPPHLYDPVRYILSLGGKRLRPALVLLAADSMGGSLEKALPAALAIEVFHNFSLVHDDIMDRAPLRRGHSTVHCRWDENTAILSGDVMMIQAYELFESYRGEDFRSLVSTFNRVARLVCEGQQLDMDYEKTAEVSREQYIRMIGLKTAVLIGGALRIGGIVASAPSPAQERLYDFGFNIGLAFQLTDDYLDTFGDQRTFGKRIGGDILDGKKTFLYIAAREKTDRAVFDAAYGLSDPQERIAAVRRLYGESGADKALEEAIAFYTDRALACARDLPVDPSFREYYMSLASSLVDRKL